MAQSVVIGLPLTVLVKWIWFQSAENNVKACRQHKVNSSRLLLFEGRFVCFYCHTSIYGYFHDEINVH